MFVAVDVVASVIVAALVSGNDIVDLIDAVNVGPADQTVGRREEVGGWCHRCARSAASTVSSTPTASFPLTSAATATTIDHAHAHVIRGRKRTLARHIA